MFHKFLIILIFNIQRNMLVVLLIVSVVRFYSRRTVLILHNITLSTLSVVGGDAHIAPFWFPFVSRDDVGIVPYYNFVTSILFSAQYFALFTKNEFILQPKFSICFIHMSKSSFRTLIEIVCNAPKNTFCLPSTSQGCSCSFSYFHYCFHLSFYKTSLLYIFNENCVVYLCNIYIDICNGLMYNINRKTKAHIIAQFECHDLKRADKDISIRLPTI